MILEFAIIDIETSGFRHVENKITEISIFIHNGKEVIDEFTTLINPECSIPYQITSLTGITNSMVKEAPKFYEVAKKVEEITRDRVFVAHSVNFDYGVISKEFKDLGGSFKRKKLCTIRLSKKVFPGLKSYSLGNLCSSLEIPISDRHRARGDARATVNLFEKILSKDSNGEVINSFLNLRNQHGTLPPSITKEQITNLPETPGVYYFYNKEGKIIYIGKAKNIKNRVVSHFRDKAPKEQRMTLQIEDIKYEETGSELIALLKESAEIKHHYPLFNRAQKRVNESIGLTCYEDRRGVIRICFNKLKLIQNPLAKFYSEREARLFIENLISEFELCPKYCHIERVTTEACFSFQLNKCKGVCCNNEDINEYNRRVKSALTSVSINLDTVVIQTPGKTESEKGIVFIENGIYKGYGFTETNEKYSGKKKIEKIISQQKDNRDIQRIINYYLKHHNDFKVISLT